MADSDVFVVEEHFGREHRRPALIRIKQALVRVAVFGKRIMTTDAVLLAGRKNPQSPASTLAALAPLLDADQVACGISGFVLFQYDSPFQF